ncbi:MAG: response regulator [Ignavibacteriales bacterium]|nr:response regulator [Ignavibacteriales bacterium]
MPKAKKHILIVDDEPSWRHMLSLYLSRKGFNVKEAGSGVEALQTLGRFKPDLIFSDVRMPDMNGFDLLDNIKKLPKLSTTPVVFCSAIDDYDAKKVAKELGAAGYLVKPFDEEEISTLLSSAFR